MCVIRLKTYLDAREFILVEDPLRIDWDSRPSTNWIPVDVGAGYVE